jgi:hypothetical protein
MLVIAVREGIYGIMHKPEYKPPVYRQEFGGRVVTQRDSGDIEPVVCIPTGDFTRVTDAPQGLFKTLPNNQ